ncbi:hypothetical protein [Vannielia litorea]|uniref:Uncharacterized protein n=1 Tax=Vannielia litorea TaxID=1217970 RepID=A0A1N6HGR4_9RHOB|nr:hypothetical protein [Vannielia litorea]SIO18795.1 hypothetical protein SAMN05444002_3348 [Vannielia litorea]
MWARQLLYGLFIASLLAMPSVVMLAYHRITGDPSLRPLAQTIAPVIFGPAQDEQSDMQVQLRLHAPTREQGLNMARQLQRTLSAKGIDAQVVIYDVPLDEPASVAFVVARNRIGPLPLSRASEGINAAVSAYRMARGI